MKLRRWGRVLRAGGRCEGRCWQLESLAVAICCQHWAHCTNLCQWVIPSPNKRQAQTQGAVTQHRYGAETWDAAGVSNVQLAVCVLGGTVWRWVLFTESECEVTSWARRQATATRSRRRFTLCLFAAHGDRFC